MQIRALQTQDAAMLLEFFRTLVRVDPARVETVAEAEMLTIQDEEKWIARLNSDEGSSAFTLVAVTDKRIVAVGHIFRMPREVERHIGDFRIGFMPEFAEVAERLSRQLIDIAEQKGIVGLIYMHFATQKLGIKLVESLGFSKAGQIPDYYRQGDDLIDRIVYYRRL